MSVYIPISIIPANRDKPFAIRAKEHMHPAVYIAKPPDPFRAWWL